MFNLNLVNSRYFDVIIGEINLQVEPCTVKTMKRFQEVSTNPGEDLAKIASTILNKNKAGYIVADEIIEALTIDQLLELLTVYFAWIAKEKSVNPN